MMIRARRRRRRSLTNLLGFLRGMLLLCSLPTFSNGFQKSLRTSSTRAIPSATSTVLANSDDHYYDEDKSSTTRKRRIAGPARVRPIRISNNQRNREAELVRKEAQARHEQALKDPTLLTNVRFQERDDIHSASKRAIAEILGLQSMTEIQSKTYAEVLAGQSVLGRARTGTGKTLAFLLPSLERILANRLYVPGQSIGALIVCPTRELAMQIADQARDLLTFHSDDLSVLCLYGGTKMAKDIGLLNNKLPTFLICTPGRLVDHLSGTRLRGRKFSDIMADTGILVLDESDRLVSGFPREMKKITSFLPRSEKRQTLLFSATLPKRMMQALEEVLPDDYAVIDCIAKDNIQAETNLRAEQSYIEVKCMENYVDALVAILIYFLEEEKELEHKIIVFFPTARLVKFFAQLFSVGIQKKTAPTFQMHSKMSQSARNKISNSFRSTKQGILLTTDISARGMDYPKVSLVIQYGSPDTVEAYTHRLGRTARIGSKGRGLLVLLPFDRGFLKKAQRRDIEEDIELTDKISELTSNNDVKSILHPALELIRNGDKVLYPAAEMAYLSILAHFMARTESRGLGKKHVLDLSNQFAKAAGLTEPPPLSDELISKLKLETIISKDK